MLRSLFQNELLYLLRYGLVGLTNTGLFVLLAWFLSKAGMHYALYTLIAYAISILFSFTVNSIFTFKTRLNFREKNFLKFIMVTISLLGAAEVIQYLLIDLAGWRERYGIATGMVCYTVVGYLLNRLWVFAPQDPQR